MQIIDANYFFTAAFTIEVVLQSIAKNFIIGPNGEPGKDLGPFICHPMSPHLSCMYLAHHELESVCAFIIYHHQHYYYYHYNFPSLFSLLLFLLSPAACLQRMFFPVWNQAVRQCDMRPAFQLAFRLAFQPSSSCLLAPIDLDAALKTACQKAHNIALKGNSCLPTLPLQSVNWDRQTA